MSPRRFRELVLLFARENELWVRLYGKVWKEEEDV
jgi:hypothetical protein